MNAVEERKVFNLFGRLKPHPHTLALLCTGLNSPWRLIQINDFTLFIRYFSFYLQIETVYFINYLIFFNHFSDLNVMKSLLKSKVSWVLIFIICKCYFYLRHQDH